MFPVKNRSMCETEHLVNASALMALLRAMFDPWYASKLCVKLHYGVCIRTTVPALLFAGLHYSYGLSNSVVGPIMELCM